MTARPTTGGSDTRGAVTWPPKSRKMLRKSENPPALAPGAWHSGMPFGRVAMTTTAGASPEARGAHRAYPPTASRGESRVVGRAGRRTGSRGGRRPCRVHRAGRGPLYQDVTRRHDLARDRGVREDQRRAERPARDVPPEPGAASATLALRAPDSPLHEVRWRMRGDVEGGDDWSDAYCALPRSCDGGATHRRRDAVHTRVVSVRTGPSATPTRPTVVGLPPSGWGLPHRVAPAPRPGRREIALTDDDGAASRSSSRKLAVRVVRP